MSTVAHDAARARVGAGLLLAMASAASFGLSGSLAKSLIDAGWTPGAAVTVRILGSVLVLAVPAYVALRGRWHLLRGNAGFMSAYGLAAVATAQLCFFNAVAHIPVGVALLLEYTAPVAVVIWLWVRHGHAPRTLTFAGAGVAAAGLVLLLDPGGGSVNLTGVLWGLGAMTGAAAYFVLSAQERNGLPPMVLAAGGLLVGGALIMAAGALGLVPMAVATADATLAGASLPWWAPVLLLAVVTAAVAYTTGIAATRRLGARLASFVALTEVLAAVLFAWLLLAQLPGWLQLAGGVLVLGGVVLVKLGDDKVVASPEPEPEPDPEARVG